MKTAAKQSSLKDTSISKFLLRSEKLEAFCNGLEEYRILLLSMMLLLQGCVLVPVTILVVSFIDIGLGAIAVGLLVMGTFGVLITNMAEASIKAILITFTLSSLSSVVLILIHLLSLK